MKTGLGLYQKYRMLISYLNLLRFGLRKTLLGFDVANLFLQRVDKYTVLLILRKYGATIGTGCKIETGQVFHNCKDYSNLIIGNNCHIGKNCFFDLRDKIFIGDNVVISMRCTILTHIDLSKSLLSSHFPSAQKRVVLGQDTYVGADTTILMGAETGKCVFMAAGSLLNSVIESYVLAGGIPAKMIRKLDIKE
ncbi:MAG: acyltransferase [Bacteroidales bacterium]|nr:acyltransferase [Bacteroidales bacterium]